MGSDAIVFIVYLLILLSIELIFFQGKHLNQLIVIYLGM